MLGEYLLCATNSVLSTLHLFIWPHSSPEVGNYYCFTHEDIEALRGIMTLPRSEVDGRAGT